MKEMLRTLADCGPGDYILMGLVVCLSPAFLAAAPFFVVGWLAATAARAARRWWP